MIKFKVGDRVKMKDVWPHTHIDWAGTASIKRGEVRTIAEVNHTEKYMKLDNGRNCWYSDMKLASNKTVIGGELC